MIYALSLLRRIKFKSAFYFALILSFIVLGFTLSPGATLFCLFAGTFTLQAAAALINKIDRQKKTDVQCPLCSYDHCVLLYPARQKSVKDKGSFACSSFDHGSYPNIYFCPLCKNGFLESLVPEKF